MNTVRTSIRPVTTRSRIRDLYAHPLGRDIIDKLLLQLGRSSRWVTNPAVGALRLDRLPRLTGGRIDAAFLDTLVDLLAQHPDVPVDDDTTPVTPAWWKEAVFYQIYPRSFADSDGDGIGDLPGIIERLDHLVDLGVDAIWLCPVYDSPNDDNGYDIRDYQAILAEFGTMADFDRLLAEVHRRGMRLVMDLVVNHTSDEHPWFVEALRDPASPYRPYYFLRPGTGEDGSEPPNNWTSFFSGSAWRHYPEHDVWALHLFSAKQMDLDWDHAPMRADVIAMVRWWLDKGVDGFRLDVVNYISKRRGLPNGNPMIGELMRFTGVEHYFAGPRLHEHLRQLRREAFAPYDAVAIGETPGVGIELGKLLTGEDRGELDLVFSFDHLEAPGKVRFDDYRYDLRHLRRVLERHQRAFGNRSWSALFLDNHDNPRMVSKVDPRPAHREAVAKLLATIQLTLRGTPFLYQGQEIGMVNQAFTSIDQLRDVESLNRYAELRSAGSTEQEALVGVLAGSRDHARTPMAWDAGPHGGFTTGVPWIEGDGDHAQCNVADSRADERSVLAWHRALIALRRAHPALVYGTVEFDRSARGHLWRYRRSGDDGEVLVVCNLSDRPRRCRPPGPDYALALRSVPGGGTADARLAAYEARVYVRRAASSPGVAPTVSHTSIVPSSDGVASATPLNR
ncbi:oligo-1,6-glucosidase [Nocardioides massiliensis]|uniref:Oligo-1,6-glucosidase n=2 Tax=Nocardioides massiliensis TaxID=1325935 RepID=A0ABT9NUN4_9ACTN|nr:alpha-glucosidase [Nocardioides massiliensis]MDP9823710.1 oligo-1,6-glucosidase [Nocardioides massiliensis]